MKKLPILLTLAVLLGVSCATYPPSSTTVWDDSVPPEQTAKIFFVMYKPVEYNNNSLGKKVSKVVSVPAGFTEFTGDINYKAKWNGSRVKFKEKGAVFSCTLEGGKEYWAIADYWNGEWGIILCEDEIKNRLDFPPYSTFIGFIPFDPPVFFKGN